MGLGGEGSASEPLVLMGSLRDSGRLAAGAWTTQAGAEAGCEHDASCEVPGLKPLLVHGRMPRALQHMGWAPQLCGGWQ